MSAKDTCQWNIGEVGDRGSLRVRMDMDLFLNGLVF